MFPTQNSEQGMQNASLLILNSTFLLVHLLELLTNFTKYSGF